MNKDQLFAAFKELFPDWANTATSYKKIGSKTLAIKFVQFGETVADKTEISRVFLYNDPNNWQFGTKLWRKRPEKDQKIQKNLIKPSKKDQIRLRNILLPYIQDISTTEECLNEMFDSFEIRKNKRN